MDGLTILIMLLISIFVFAIIISLFAVVGQWKMFKKAGKNGWEALVPIYNQYILCKITGVNPIWIAILFGSVLLAAIPVIGSIVSMLVSIYFPILLAISTAKSFGKDDVWGLGLFFFAPIFYMILGFGASEYVGPTPMNDVVLELFGVKNEVNNNEVPNNVTAAQSTDSMSGVKFCSACGSKVVSGNVFCGNCGHKI